MNECHVLASYREGIGGVGNVIQNSKDNGVGSGGQPQLRMCSALLQLA